MRRTFIAVLLVLVTGCTSAVTLRHPATGAIAKCGPYTMALGIGSVYTAMERERQCVSDYQRQGYERAPEGAERPK